MEDQKARNRNTVIKTHDHLTDGSNKTKNPGKDLLGVREESDLEQHWFL